MGFETGLSTDEELPRADYVYVETPNPHVMRARQILQEHPEIRDLYGREPRTALWGAALVLLQLTIAASITHWSWFSILVLSYVVGAFIDHALWVLIHECGHNLVFRRLAHNRLLAIYFNFPLVVPSAVAFGKYHMFHHTHQSQLEYDGDLASHQEADWIGNSRLKKLLLMFFFSFVQGAIRPSQIKTIRLWDFWTILNTVIQLAFLAAWTIAVGWISVVYLALSMFFSIGLHPLGGRWIAEHYLVHEHQETNSYYGGLNKLCFNMGYHNEHHDFMRIPWSRLPEVKKIAPEHYEGLHSYRSWTAALVRFIWSKKVSLYDRVVRRKRVFPGANAQTPAASPSDSEERS